MSNETKYPLAWPDGWPRTPAYKRTRSRYQRAFARDRDALLRRLARMGATTPVLSTNVALRLDGLPMASQRAPTDPGVAVYFDRRGGPHVIACDAWATVDENLRAVLRTLEALAAIERSGSAQLEDRAYAGFARLPSAVEMPHWSRVLSLELEYKEWKAGWRRSPQLLEAVDRAHRDAALDSHPDRPSGSHEAMSRLNIARDAARKEIG